MLLIPLNQSFLPSFLCLCCTEAERNLSSQRPFVSSSQCLAWASTLLWKGLSHPKQQAPSLIELNYPAFRACQGRPTRLAHTRAQLGSSAPVHFATIFILLSFWWALVFLQAQRMGRCGMNLQRRGADGVWAWTGAGAGGGEACNAHMRRSQRPSGKVHKGVRDQRINL